MTVLSSAHGEPCKSEPTGDPLECTQPRYGGEARGRGRPKKSSSTFSLLSEHDIVRIRGEKWGSFGKATLRTRVKVEKSRGNPDSV